MFELQIYYRQLVNSFLLFDASDAYFCFASYKTMEIEIIIFCRMHVPLPIINLDYGAINYT